MKSALIGDDQGRLVSFPPQLWNYHQ